MMLARLRPLAASGLHVRSLAKAASAGDIAKIDGPPRIVEAKYIVSSFSVPIGTEGKALAMDLALDNFKKAAKGLKKGTEGITGVTRAVCPSTWDYRVDLEYRDRDTFGAFFESPEGRKLLDGLVKSLSELSGSAPHVQHYFFSRFMVNAPKTKQDDAVM